MAVLALGATGVSSALADDDGFDPLPASSPCQTTVGDDPFLVPSGYQQTVVAREGQGGTADLWDMNTQNETGKDAGRYVYRAHEINGNGQVSVTDLKTGVTKEIARRADWERFDGVVWTPWNTLLVAEETNPAAQQDPAAPGSTGGLVYEFFIDPSDPSKLRTTDPRDTVAPTNDGIAVRPQVGSRSHEGLRFDKRGNLYGISEVNGGSVFRFTPDRKGDLSSGQLSALETANGHDGEGTWVPLTPEEARTNSQTAATARGANGYSRPEDVETGESTGKDRNNGGNTLYVAITGTDEVLAVDLSQKEQPIAYKYVAGDTSDFDSPDNLALDREGNLAITEDPSSNPVGADVWIAAAPRDRHQGSTVQRFASLKDCPAEPTGIYFASAATDRWTEGTPREGLVTSESLLVNRQHAGAGTTQDQLVAIDPVGSER
jgi:secreted PhoX family phosphatase